MRPALLALILISTMAQAPAPGSGAGGPVGPSGATPRAAEGVSPPGTPSGETAGDRALRDAAGNHVIGTNETPATAVPGNTTAPDTGVRK